MKFSRLAAKETTPECFRQRGFSLIELMVVVSVMTVLLALGASTLSSPKGSREIAQAGGMLTDLAALARQNAVSKNTRTVLYVGRVVENGATNYVASIWDPSTTNQLERWNILPSTVELVDSTEDAPTSDFRASFRNQPLAGPNLCYWFYPDGRTGNDISKIRRLKVQSSMVLAGQPPANYYELIFNPMTGLAKAVRPGDTNL